MKASLLVWGAGLLVATAQAASAAQILINDGGDHVVDTVAYTYHQLFVRNVGCDTLTGPCASPGAPTRLTVRDGGVVGSQLRSGDTSTVRIEGGTVWGSVTAAGDSLFFVSGGAVGLPTTSGGALQVLDRARITFSGGTLTTGLFGYGEGVIDWSGGELIDGVIQARDSSEIRIRGRQFTVDGAPVPLGALSAETGALAGTLASGETFNAVFWQGSATFAGTIFLVPEPGTGLLLGIGLAGIAFGGRRSRPR